MRARLAVVVLGAMLAGCPAPIPPTVVAPTGPATAQVAPAIDENLAKQAAATEAIKAAASKIGAASTNIGEFNALQPDGPFTIGITGENATIMTLASPYITAEDRAAALERALTVKTGDLAKIQAAYSDAAKAIQALNKQLGDTQTALNASNAALKATEAKAAAEQATLQTKYQKQMDDVTSKANARVLAAESAQRKLELGIFFGFGALLLVGGIVILVTSAQVPMFGPRVGFALILSGVGLIATGIAVSEVQNFISAHPWIVGAGLLTCLVLAVAAAVLMYANHKHHMASLSPEPATTAKP